MGDRAASLFPALAGAERPKSPSPEGVGGPTSQGGFGDGAQVFPEMDPVRTYRVVRELSRAIHSDALKDVPTWALVRGAERLRMLGKRGVLVFGSEEETAVLAQFVLYEILVGGAPIILRHLEKRSPPRNAVEEELVRGIRQSFSSLFRVETVRRDGVMLRDLLTSSQELHTLVDLGLIHTGRPACCSSRGYCPCGRMPSRAGSALPLREITRTS